MSHPPSYKVTSPGYPSLRWVMLGLIYLCMLAFALVFQAIPPVLNLIIKEFGVSHASAGLLMSMFALPGLILSIPAGIMADSFGVKRIGILALSFMIVGTVILATANNFTLLIIGRAVSGIGAMTLAIVSPQAVAQWFRQRGMGVAMGIFNTAMPLGTIISLNALAVLAENMGWRASTWTGAAVSGLALVAFSVIYQSPPRTVPPIESRGNGIIAGIKGAGLPIWLVGLSWGWFNASVISLFTFTPDFLIRTGIGLGYAGFLTSLVMGGPLLLSPGIGFLLDRVGRKDIFIGIGGLFMGGLLLLVPGATSGIVPLMIGIGVANALIPAPVFALIPDVVKPQNLGLGYGIVSTMLNLGVVVGPYIAGLSRDLTGSYQTSFWSMAFFSLLTTVTITAFHFERRHDLR